MSESARETRFKKRNANNQPLTKEKPTEGAVPKGVRLAFPDLREKYGTVEEMEAYLKKLDKPTLEALILISAFPEAKSDLRHCVYCHKMYNSAKNTSGCSVTHFCDTEYGEEETKLCCGKNMEDVDRDEGMLTMEDMYPYCYEGRHWEREITTDDEEGEETDPDDLGMIDENGDFVSTVWWREWRRFGDNCEKMKCASRVTRAK